MLLESAVLCLAANIYFEARGEMIPGQYGVAQVTLNRAKDPERICDTVLAKDQFSWTKGLVAYEQGRPVLKKKAYPKDEHAWWLANRIASYAINYRPADITWGATHYHATYVSPKWRHSMQLTKRMGGHVFYKAENQSRVTEKL